MSCRGRIDIVLVRHHCLRCCGPRPERTPAAQQSPAVAELCYHWTDIWRGQGAFQLAKDGRKKRQSAEATNNSGKMKRKEFEKELAKLQLELVRLQTWA